MFNLCPNTTDFTHQQCFRLPPHTPVGGSVELIIEDGECAPQAELDWLAVLAGLVLGHLVPALRHPEYVVLGELQHGRLLLALLPFLSHRRGGGAGEDRQRAGRAAGHCSGEVMHHISHFPSSGSPSSWETAVMVRRV